jgi:hypothetical protein
VLASISNPNVYFKDTVARSNGVQQQPPSNELVLTVRSGASSPNLTQITDISELPSTRIGPPPPPPQPPPPPLPVPAHELSSEEASALAAFDRIYENLDVSVTTDGSESLAAEASSSSALHPSSVHVETTECRTSDHHFINPAFVPDFLHES